MATAGLDSYCPACLLPCATPVAAPAAPLHHPSCSNHLHRHASQQQAAEQPVYVHKHSSNPEWDSLTGFEGSKSGKTGQVGGSNRGVVVGGSSKDVTAAGLDDREVIATLQQASDAQQQLLPSSATAEAGNFSEASSEQLLAWVSVSSPYTEVVCRQNFAGAWLHACASALCSCDICVHAKYHKAQADQHHAINMNLNATHVLQLRFWQQCSLFGHTLWACCTWQLTFAGDS